MLLGREREMEDLGHVLEVGLDGPVTAHRQADGESGLRVGSSRALCWPPSLFLSLFFP